MRTTRAYIASAGTASVMLGASLAMFAMVSAFVAFGSWPGANTASKVDQVFLRAVQRPAAPQKVAVHANAVAVANHAAVRRQVALARTHHSVQPGGSSAPAGTRAAKGPAGTGGSSTVAPAASSPTTVAQQPLKTVSGKVGDTTTTTGQTVQNLQTQVNQVVDQVTTPPPPPTQSGDVVGTTVQQVQTTAGSVLGH